MDDTISERLLDQRLRNRIMEALLGLVDWREDLPSWGAGEYFEGVFDFLPYRRIWPNSALTDAERLAVSKVHGMMAAACDSTPKFVTTDRLIATGWPVRIATAAEEALAIMLERGRFSEDEEEDTPSTPIAWP